MESIISRKRPRAASLEVEPSVKVAKIFSSLPSRMMKHSEKDVSPMEYVVRLVKNQGIDVEIHDSLSLDGFFSEYTEEEVAAYDADVLQAARSQDIEKLREFHTSGRPLKCSNSFGESLLHLSCRRNYLKVVKFLIQEAHVPVRLRDDYGRTVLHDAAWACEPNFELIELILAECPDLLFMSDRRGHTPIAYARQSHWAAWNKFLEEQAHLVIPTIYRTSLVK